MSTSDRPNSNAPTPPPLPADVAPTPEKAASVAKPAVPGPPRSGAPAAPPRGPKETSKSTSGTATAMTSGAYPARGPGASGAVAPKKVFTPRPASPRALGGLLRNSAELSEAVLLETLAEQEELRRGGGATTEGTRLGELLVKRRAVTEDQVLQALGVQFDLPVMLELKPETIEPDLAQRVPINFAKQHRLLLLRRQPGTGIVEVGIADPTAVHVLDDVRRAVGGDVEAVLIPESQIVEAINKVYSRDRIDADLHKHDDDAEEAETEEDVDLVDLNDEAPIIRWVNSVIFHAVRMRASDIHMEPHEKDFVVRYRVDNNLEEYKRAPRNFINSITARVKIMAGLNIAEKRLPQDGRIRRKIAGKDIDMRVATVPTGFGERITIRLLDRSAVLLNLSDLGFGEDHLETMTSMINRPHGIILVTGPTGSGKTTTLYAALSQINTPDINILTVEDPVEYQLDGISQIQVNPKIELTFAASIRSFLRHDPDVIMVGEIRDQETASMAITASLTGHLVLSTIHTNDAASAVTRLIDMGIEPFLVTSSLATVLAQRLVRRLCPS